MLKGSLSQLQQTVKAATKRPQRQQQQQQQSSAAMIATANSTPVNWIESRHHEGEDATVISEITNDQTAAMGGDSLINILGDWTKANAAAAAMATPDQSAVAASNLKLPGSPKKGDDGSFTEKPTMAINKNASQSSGFSTSKAGPAKKPTPQALAQAAAAKANARAKAVPVKPTATTTTSTRRSSSSHKSSHKGAPKTPTLKAAPSTSTTTTSTMTTKIIGTPPRTTTEEATKKKAPYPSMDVSPNPHVKVKNKVSSSVTSPNWGVTATAAATASAGMKPAAVPKLSTPPRSSKPAPNSKAVTPSSTASSPSNIGGVGLSELSKQLRVQRAKNEWQHNEIARLERQLRILSDLKGVSVVDLRHSLESACQEEAHGELRNQVASLQAQLEAVQMQRQNNRRASTANTEAAQSKIATLQLRIGELEEVDQAKHQEVQALYQQLQQQTARATTLEATNAQQQAQLFQFEQVAQAYVKDVEKIQAERDGLKQQVAELMQQIAGFENQRKLDQAMREIEQQIELEQKRKQEYIQQARLQQAAAARSAASVDGSVYSQNTNMSSMHPGPPLNNRLAQNQVAAIASTIATSVRPDEEENTALYPSSGNSSVMTGPSEFDDDVSRLGDDHDIMSVSAGTVHTIDALVASGLTQEQAEEAMAKDAKITSLYDELREHATKASQLQTLCANQKAQVERFAEQLNEKEANLRSTQSNYDFAKTEHDSLYKRFCDIELQLTLEQEKVEGLEQQLNARVHESNLRNDQFKCRFQVQNERIADLEQQQSSLYAAFELLQQEVRAQDSEHNKLKSSLDEADSEVARQLRESEKKKRSSRRRSSGGGGRASLSASQRNLFDGGSQRNLFNSSMSGNGGGMDHSAPAHSTPVATATPVASQVDAYAAAFDNSTALSQEQTAQLQGIDIPMRTYGYLWKLDKIKGWKKRFFVLYGEGGFYQMTYSDSPKERVKGTIHNITMGVSTVAETNKSIKKPFSFVLHVDPLHHSGQVLYAAALTAEDFRKWMTALKAATIRPEDSMYLSQPNLSQEAQIEADMEIARQLQGSSRDLGGSRHQQTGQESQIEADHLIAMRMQIQNQPNQAFA